MKNVVLVGYMGCGKTTVAKILSERLKIKRVDLDQLIEIYSGLSIEKLFLDKGELYFRKLEHQLFLDQIDNLEPKVLSTGGGTPCYFDHHKLLQTDKVVSIYLKASLNTLVNRLKFGKKKRPLIANKTDDELKEFIAKHLFERNYYYNQASFVVEVDGKSLQEIVAEISYLLA
ncbi:shikimate kinase [Flavobacterium sp. SUN046]|uniref:shikimate kinase n=1 Tax=Flavobacterium sp. SUN046 TaxID=3002440 RepID=UPI002DBFDEC2|nr:shikimate kinase [Flavobacterium sp. SUN046]MEC4048819.1 shikimate kinase [Flavobacterium sp. SUN046]